MNAAPILITYDGGDAIRHSIDARLLGQSLQGISKIISDCTVVLSLQRLPRRGDRPPLILKVKEPKASSFAVPGLAQEVSQLLAIGVPIMQAIGPEIISHYVKAVLDYFQGKEETTEVAIKAMADMHQRALEAISSTHRDALSTIDSMDERRHQESLGMQDLLRRSILASGPAAVDYVAPVGCERSVDTACFKSGSGDPFIINGKIADAIRDSQKMEWRPIGNAVFKTDGFKYHSSALSIENPERDGFMMAEVVDPSFEEDSNPYTTAAQRRAMVEVIARKGYKNGTLAKIQILEFVRECSVQ